MLVVRGLDLAYGRVAVLREVSLHVDRGETVTIVGPNGSGKTSLLRALTGLVAPAAGTVTFEGHELAGRPVEEIVRRGLVLVPEGRELFGALTVRENLALGAYARGRAGRRASLAADLERVLGLFPPLAIRLGQAVGTLSGGEQQMVAVGRALMARPRLLLLDEPSVGLAPLVVREIFRVLARLKADGLTILLVEQNARAALRLADRGYALGPGGRIEAVTGDGQADGSARRAYGFEFTRQEIPS